MPLTNSDSNPKEYHGYVASFTKKEWREIPLSTRNKLVEKGGITANGKLIQGYISK